MIELLLIGDYESAKWHSMKGFDALISNLYKDGKWTLVKTDELTSSIDFSTYRVVVSLCDQWTPLEENVAINLTNYLNNGGSLLMIHQGISLQSTPQLKPLLGGSFNGHPQEALLSYRISNPTLDFTKNISDFQAFEEPYDCALDGKTNTIEFLNYSHQGRIIPAGWYRSQSIGHIVYLSPGHHLETLKNPAYQTLIKQTLEWLIQKNHRSL